MHQLIERIMGKRGITLDTLTTEEKKTFDGWQATLTAKKVTAPQIAEFCDRQKSAIETQWTNLENNTQKNERLILLHTIYSKISSLIQSDKNERESLEKYLTTLIDNSD